MPLEPDPRWGNFIAMSLEVLQDVAADLGVTVDEVEPCGGTELLETSRWLLVTSWFRYEFLALAALVGFQAVEAVFRQIVYPEAPATEPFRRLIKRAAQDGNVVEPFDGILDAGAELRNGLSHPGGQVAFTIGMVEPMLLTSHLFVRDLCLDHGMRRLTS